MTISMMKNSIRVAGIAAALVCATAAQATITVYSVTLNGASESPPNASPGVGSGTVTIDTVANTMTVNFSFSGLLGTTTASHIHAATAVPFTGTAGVATTTPTFAGFPLGVPSGSYFQVLDLTQASSYNPAFITANTGSVAGAESALLSAISAGEAYLNVHTTVVPGGEIRSFLVAVPEPATWMTMLLGFAAIGFALRRRRTSPARV